MVLTLISTLMLAGPVEANIQIEGEGYLRFAREGRIVYARSARLVAVNNRLESSGGAVVIPLMEVPVGTTRLQVDPDGTIHAVVKGATRELGALMLAVFAKPSSVQASGNYFIASSRPTLHHPGDGKAGLVVSSSPVVDGKRQPNTTTKVTPSTSKYLTISIPETVQVAGERITLDSIATFEGEIPASIRAIDLGPAPKPGVPLKYQLTRLRARLKAMGFSESQIALNAPETVVFEAAGQIITPETFLEYARRASGLTSEAAKLLEPSLPIEAFTAPLGKLELRTENSLAAKNSVTIRIGIFVDSRRVNSKTITLTGDSLATLIKAGSVVKVRFVAGTMTVEATGIAKKDARMGEVVEVTTQQGDATSKTSHLALVIGPGLVEVKLP